MTEKEKTAPVVSVGADTEQSILKQTDNSITDFNEFDKGLDNYLEEMQKEFLQQLDPSHLKTVSMSELYNTVYQSKPPLIDGLLYPGTYIFAGAPKLGKSFLMAQLAYHISTGTPLWNFDVKKALCCTLLSKTTIIDCRKDYTECLERRVQTICTFLFRQVNLEMDLTNSLQDLWQNTQIQN